MKRTINCIVKIQKDTFGNVTRKEYCMFPQMEMTTEYLKSIMPINDYKLSKDIWRNGDSELLINIHYDQVPKDAVRLQFLDEHEAMQWYYYDTIFEPAHDIFICQDNY